MNELHFGNKVRQILNQGLREAANAGDAALGERLRAARERALARQRAEPAAALAWADSALGRVGGWTGLSLRLLVPGITLVVAWAGLYMWQQNRQAAEVEELDTLLLTDDLPIDAYLDRGFQTWLKKRAAEE